jgi:hypothetical protein
MPAHQVGAQAIHKLTRLTSEDRNYELRITADNWKQVLSLERRTLHSDTRAHRQQSLAGSPLRGYDNGNRQPKEKGFSYV